MNDFDKFMEQFFIDPFTSLMDQQKFRIDVFETNDEYQVEADLMNYDKDSIEVHAVEGGIKVLAFQESKAEVKDEKNQYYHSEESYSSLQRFIPLPVKVSAKNVKAIFENGILTVHVPKNNVQQSLPGIIPVQSK